MTGSEYLRHMKVDRILLLNDVNIFDEEKDFFCVKCGANVIDSISFKIKNSYIVCADCLANSTVKYARSGDRICINILIDFAESCIRDNMAAKFAGFAGDVKYA